MENLPTTVYVAIGAIAAAFISGFWSLISLIISKDQKVSEFRQQWIDSLRKDVSKLAGLATGIKTSWYYFKNSHSKVDAGRLFIKENIESVNQFDAIKASIVLRLNPEEHNSLITMLNDLDRMVSSPELLDSKGFGDLVDSIVDQVQIELKKEWERVKSGEKSYRYMRNFLLISFVVAGVAFAIKLYA